MVKYPPNLKNKISYNDLDIDHGRIGNMKKDDIEYIVIHHSGVEIDQSAQTIHDFHVNEKGWAGIGYHFWVRYKGLIEKGRPLSKLTPGAHVKGYNYSSIGICAAGNFNEVEPTNRQEQFISLVEITAFLKSLFPGTKIIKHSDKSDTNCPGLKFPWDYFLEQVERQENDSNNIDVPDWKLTGLEYLQDEGLADIDYWIGRINEPMPVWASMILDYRIYKKLKEGE